MRFQLQRNTESYNSNSIVRIKEKSRLKVSEFVRVKQGKMKNEENLLQKEKTKGRHLGSNTHSSSQKISKALFEGSNNREQLNSGKGVNGQHRTPAKETSLFLSEGSKHYTVVSFFSDPNLFL